MNLLYSSALTNSFFYFSDEILRRTDHKCLPNVAQEDVDICLSQAKKRAREEIRSSVPQIFEEEMVPVFSKGLEFVTEIPNFRSIKGRLYDARRKTLGIQSFKSRKEIVLPSTLTEDFLICDDGGDNKILVFASSDDLKVLSENENFFGDGTFKSCCPQFAQLYTIHVDIRSTPDETNILPAAYALLPDKQESTYIRLFTLLKKLVKWNPKTFTIDYESACISAIRKCFEDIKLFGCNFHFNQCLWRKVQSIGLSTLYVQNELVRRHVRMCAALAYLPPEYVDEGWLSIMEDNPDEPLVGEFNDYFVGTWLENDFFKPLWCCYGRQHRTTNAVEGWHNRLNKRISNVHPNIFVLVQALKQESQHSNNVRSQLELFQTPKRRKTKYIQLDRQINEIINQFLSQQNNVKYCLVRLGYLIKM